MRTKSQRAQIKRTIRIARSHRRHSYSINRTIDLPEEFPSPKFTYGNEVITSEGNVGRVVGMTFYQRGFKEAWWGYQLDLYVWSKDYWNYYDPDVSDSPSTITWDEADLTLSKRVTGKFQLISKQFKAASNQKQKVRFISLGV